jgi:FkbM family methyltransferase
MKLDRNRTNLWLLFALLALLLVEVVRGVGEMRQAREQPGTYTTPHPTEEIAPPLPVSNDIPAERLAPRLLHDREDIQRYVDQFPREAYRIVRVTGLGSFYLDDAKDEIKDVLRAGQVWEPSISQIIARNARAGSTVLDVGAHIGSHALTMAKAVGESGRVYAFEPQRKIFRELVHNIQLNGLRNVELLRFAVGDNPTVIEMDRSREGNEGGTSIGRGGDKAELRTIDSFGFRNVSLIKIDVEGFEDHVLLGGRKTITEQRPFLIIEIQSAENFDNARPEVRAKIVHTIQLIEQMGYFVRRISIPDYIGIPTARRLKAPKNDDPPDARSGG